MYCGRCDLIPMSPGQFLGEHNIPLGYKSVSPTKHNGRDRMTYQFTLAVQLIHVVLAPVRRVLEGCKVKAGAG